MPANFEASAQLNPTWLGARTLNECCEQFDRDGYLIFENVIEDNFLSSIRDGLAPYIGQNLAGRNEFEGRKTNRIYALLAKSPVFADLATHPLALAFVEADLGAEALLSACLAINLHPEETPQPWHFDDSHYRWPRPRPSLGVSAFWAIDAMTEENGATEIIPGSHLWPDDEIAGCVASADFDREAERQGDPGARSDAVKVIMPAGSLMLTKGTLWHRGGANRSDEPRLIITPQYCAGWTRQLENMLVAVPPEVAKTLPRRAQELIGYNIHPPFMGYVDGRHPLRTLDQ